MLRLHDSVNRNPFFLESVLIYTTAGSFLPSTVCYLPCAGRSSHGKTSQLEVSSAKGNSPTGLQPPWVSDGGRQAAPTGKERQAGAEGGLLGQRSPEWRPECMDF